MDLVEISPVLEKKIKMRKVYIQTNGRTDIGTDGRADGRWTTSDQKNLLELSRHQLKKSLNVFSCVRILQYVSYKIL